MHPQPHWSVFLQYMVPQQALSRFAGWVASCKLSFVKNFLIRWFIWRYGVDMREVQDGAIDSYENFQSFFIRQLKKSARPIESAQDAVVSPVDGVISQIGAIQAGRAFQAKGFDFSVVELLGGQTAMADLFLDGQFATLYLAPKDYHRVHMPLTGRLTSMTYVPGRLFSVNPKTAATVPRLFARNERVICMFETEFGPMAVILIGAMIVASIHIVWGGDITPTSTNKVQTWTYVDQNIILEKGSEIGHFKLGSTVIVLFGDGRVRWNSVLSEGVAVRMGLSVGRGKY
jgi:phosphatidylserine decarboxylase